MKLKPFLCLVIVLVIFLSPTYAQKERFSISVKEYKDKIKAIWYGQMLGAIMGWPFEHKVASTEWISSLNPKFKHAPVDDDWYYEMVAIRGFEKYGVNMTVQQLGQQWLQNSAGSWGSSEQARILMSRGILPPDCGHPRYNKLWFTIGPQFSSDLYGALAPAMPNLAAKMARYYGHINGYAEAVDGAVFIAGMISIAFKEQDPHVIVSKAAQLIDASSPYRKCIEMVLEMAQQKKKPAEIIDAIENEWHIEYPATNNAVANGGIVATSVLFGETDFLKTINLAYGAADFTDADCNAANAAAVIGAIGGTAAIPSFLINSLGDSIIGDKMGKVRLTPVVHETISGLGVRTASIGIAILKNNGAEIKNDVINISYQQPKPLPAELFSPGDLTAYWNPEWKLERAGFGGAQGGMPGIRGITYLENDVLATYPRDEVKAVVLSRKMTIKTERELSFMAGVDSGKVWQCVVYVNNQKLFDALVEGNHEPRHWVPVNIDISSFQNKDVLIRLYQRVLIPGKISGNAYWKHLEMQ